MHLQDLKELDEILKLLEESGLCRADGRSSATEGTGSFVRQNSNKERRLRMQVQDVMVREAKSCRLDTNLAAATEIMWVNDCGALPVLDGGEKVVGMITDRDICIAVGTRNRLPSDIAVSEVISRKVFACAPKDEIHRALQTMQLQKVRRLPVTSEVGKLKGILCLNDLARNAKRSNALSYEDVVETLRAVCEHRVQQAVAA